jgi:hypothetical protein
MATQLDQPDGSGAEDREQAVVSGATGPPSSGASEAESGRDDGGMHATERRAESEHSVDLDSASALAREALSEARGETTTARPHWSQARRLPERSDVVLDASHLSVDELSLEVEGDVGIKHLRLDTKGLEAQLFVRADLGNVVSLVKAAGTLTPPIVETAKHAGGASNGGLQARRVASPAGAALAGLAAGGALVARMRPTGRRGRRALDRMKSRSALSSFVRGLT